MHLQCWFSVLRTPPRRDRTQLSSRDLGPSATHKRIAALRDQPPRAPWANKNMPSAFARPPHSGQTNAPGQKRQEALEQIEVGSELLPQAFREGRTARAQATPQARTCESEGPRQKDCHRYRRHGSTKSRYRLGKTDLTHLVNYIRHLIPGRGCHRSAKRELAEGIAQATVSSADPSKTYSHGHLLNPGTFGERVQANRDGKVPAGVLNQLKKGEINHGFPARVISVHKDPGFDLANDPRCRIPRQENHSFLTV